MTADEDTLCCWSAQGCPNSGLRPESSFDCWYTLTTAQHGSSTLWWLPGFERSSLPSALSLLTQICPESMVSLRQPCLCYGGHHALSKMQSKRLPGTAWAGLGCGLHRVNWLWRGTAAWSVNYHPLPMAGTTWHLKHQEALYKEQASQTHKDMPVVLQLYINCAALNISKKRMFHY